MRTRRLAVPIVLALALLACAAQALRGQPAPPPAAASVSAPWTVFTPATNTLPMAGNVITNTGFELVPLGDHGWQPYGSGYAVATAGAHGGLRALELANLAPGETHGAYQYVLLNQSMAKPLYFSAWSRTLGVAGSTDSDYSLYVDVYYASGTPLWGQVLKFDTGTHDWQFREGFIVPDRPIHHLYAYCLLRGNHTGTAWFDDIIMREVQADIATFDGVQVATARPAGPPFGGTPLTLAVPGLTLTLTSEGGAVTGVRLHGIAIADAAHDYASGFFVRDVTTQGDFVHVGSALAQDGGSIAETGTIPALDLTFAAQYSATPDGIRIHAALTDTSGADRALTLYYALPVLADGWQWGDDIRHSREITGAGEFAEFGWEEGLGATGYLSRYPYASLDRGDDGLALAIPLDEPRLARLIHNAATNQFYVAFDLGLSPLTTHAPSRATVDLLLYPLDDGWGFRAATAGYISRHPQFFARRVPPEREGIWIAFSDLAPITDTADFGIAFHELGGLSQVAFDDGAGVYSFRYITEPWSHWLPIDDPGVDPQNYAQVMAYLFDRYQNGTAAEHDRAEATLSSGFFDENGLYRYESTVAPWCSGVAGCAVFTLNPDPDIADATYPLNKAYLEWNAAAHQTYTTTPGLDGEYVDSYEGRSSVLDYRAAHLAAVDTPPVFATGDTRLGVPELFATTEFARWLAADVHGSLGKWTMANGILLNAPWGADLFDFMGQETDWLSTGTFVPAADATMNYRRTLSGQRPYGLLMNTNFDNLSYDLVERYFQTCLFYGIYPSMFSHNAAENRYWDNPALYNRDRPLFRRYIPLIRRINVAGWQPVTHATSSDAQIYVERFGAGTELYFTLRNTRDVTATVTLTVQANALGLATTPLAASALIAQAGLPVSGTGGTRSITMDLAPQTSEIVYVHAWQVYLPAIR